ncbi:MAG: O-antigen ligase family protein [candidate division WOR-3 bacterium]
MIVQLWQPVNNQIKRFVVLVIEKKSQYSIIFLSIIYCVISILLTLRTDEPIKTVIALWALGILIFLYKINRLYALCFVVFTIPLPIHLRYLERDAMTITTLLILILFLIELIKGHIEFVRCGKATLIFALLFVVVNSVTLFFNLKGDELLFNLRHYLSFLSSIMLYFLVISTINNKDEFNKILLLIGASLIIQVFVLILASFQIRPSFFNIFTTRIGEFITRETRPGGIIDDYELIAEWFAVYIPFTFWLFYISQKKSFSIILIFMLLLGMMITRTRGALFSLAFGIIIFFICFPSKNILQRIKFIFSVLALICTSLIIIKAVFPAFYEVTILRILQTFQLYAGGSSFDEIVNRQIIWQLFFDNYFTFNLLGSGRISPTSIRGYFHSLYFTLYYQTGLLGIISFGLFVISIIILVGICCVQRSAHYEIRFLATVSLAIIFIFLIDEIKIEYLRGSCFSQYAWLFLGLVTLPSSFCRKLNSISFLK